MKRSNDVFFFTQIDLLLQILFFGLVLFVVGQTAVHAVLKQAGVSNLTELSDKLTKLVPADSDLETFVRENGGRKYIRDAVEAVRKVGGPEKVGKLQGDLDAADARVKTLEGERWGAPSCVAMVNGRPPTVARVVVRDESITLESPRPEFLNLLSKHGLKLEDVQTLQPEAFRATFARVVASDPGCRYFQSSEAKTKYLAPMRAVWSAFRTL